MFNYKFHIFCCVNERADNNPKGCCKTKGSEKLFDYLKKTVHEKGLKKTVKVSASKCLGACSLGPAVVIYPEGVWYKLSEIDDAAEILEKHIVNGNVVERLVMK